MFRANSSLSSSKVQRSQRNWTVDDVSSHLEKAFRGGDQEPAKAVRQILEACKNKEEKEPCCRTVFEKCIEALNANHLHSKVAKEIIGNLSIEVGCLSGSSQVGIAEKIVRGLKEGHHPSLELFPKLLATIASQKAIKKPEGGSGEMMGEEHRSHLLNSLFGCRWDPSCVLPVIDMCKDITMIDDELKFLIQKILQMMESLDLTEIPPLVYQLLSLSKKGHKTLILEGLKSLFDHLDRTMCDQEEESEDSVTTCNENELLTIEGTVFVHIAFAIKQDPDLRKEFLKMLKVSQERLSSAGLSLFSVSLTLSAVCIHRLEDTVHGFFKDVILRSYKDEERIRSSKWLQELSDDLVDIESLLMTAVNRSTSGWSGVIHGSGWDQVVQGLVSVGLFLMESFVPKSSTLSQSGTPQRKACALGTRIVAEVFKKHSMVRHDVVTQIINRVMTNSAANVSHYINLLSQLMRNTSQMDLMDSLPKLKESLSYIAMIPSMAAGQLLSAILPLIQFSASLRDCLLLVLRKALFSIHIEARKTAVEGYLLLLRKFKVLDSVGSITDSQLSSGGSQTSVEVHGSGNHGNEGLCLEILGILRRALTKQFDVKLSLYQGLYSVFCANTRLAAHILDLLIGHFDKFYEKDTDLTPPIILAPCLKMNSSGVIATEPLDHLVCCIQLCVCHYLQQDEIDDKEIPEIIGEAQQTLTSLVTRMISSGPDDFEVNKSSDFSNSSVGLKNRLYAQLAMGTYETLLDYTFCAGQFSQESCEQVLKLYQGYQQLANIIQDKGSSTSSSHGTKKGAGVFHSRLSLQCVLRLLRGVFSDQTPNHQQGLTVLRDSQAFLKYVLGVALQKIHQIHDTGVCDGSYVEHKPDLIFKSSCTLARLMFKHIDLGGTRPPKKEKGKSVGLYCLEGFTQLLHMAVVQWDRGDEFLTAVNPNLDQGTCASERSHYFIRHLQRVVGGVMDSSSKEWSLKEAQLMVNSMELLASTLELGSQELDKVFEWAYAQCKDHNIDEPPLTKALISLLLSSGERHRTTDKPIRKLAQDVHYHLGDIDEDFEVEATPTFSIVNPRTAASSVLTLLYSHIEHVLGNIDWLVGRLKIEVSSSPSDDAFGRSGSQVTTQARDTCSSVCQRLTHLVLAGSNLVQSSIPAGPSSEGLLKILTKLFSTLSNLAKYVLDIYQYTSNVPTWFQKLAALVGQELSSQVYVFIPYIQKMQIHGALLLDGGKKGGKGKSKAGGTGKSSIRKESRTYSSLIFTMEQFEKHLIQLDKKTKGNLMEPFKHSMSRDFRIDAQVVGSCLEEEELSSEEGEEEKGDCNPPSAKKARKS